MYFLVIDYSFNVCACTEIKHVRAINRGSFLLHVTGLYSVDQRIDNKNTDLQQNGELILNILQETIQTIYDE